MSELRRHPVARGKVLAGLAVFLLVTVGLIAMAEWLRPGQSASDRLTPQPDADPRVEVECEAPTAREGLRPRARGDARPTLVTSSDLYDCPSTWDSRRVRYVGEVVGAVLQRGEYAWVQLNDDHYSTDVGPLPSHRDFRGGNGGVGVAVPVAFVREIQHVGGPRMSGDIVEVTGIYHRVDRQTREVAVIRAETARVVERCAAVDQPVETERIAVAAVLGLAAASLLGLQWRARRRR